MIDCPRYPRRLDLKHIFVSCEVCQCTCDIPTGKYHGGKKIAVTKTGKYHGGKNLLSRRPQTVELPAYPRVVRISGRQFPLHSSADTAVILSLKKMSTNVVHFPENRICAKRAFNWSVCCRSCGGTTTACTWSRNWSVILTTSCALLTSHGIVCTAPGLKTS